MSLRGVGGSSCNTFLYLTAPWNQGPGYDGYRAFGVANRGRVGGEFGSPFLMASLLQRIQYQRQLSG
jgi:hypothetical protein